MRILLTDFFGIMAGSTYAIFDIAEGLKKRGHHVIVGCRKGTFFHELLGNSDLIFEVFDPKHKIDLKAIRQFAELVKREKIEVVNAQGSTDRYISIFARWFFGMKTRLIHTRQQKPVGLNRLKAIFYSKGTDAIIAVSEPVKQFLVQSGIPANHIRMVHNAIQQPVPNPELTEGFRANYSISPRDIVIGCVSRIKKQNQILKALKKIDTPVTVLFVGIDGSFPNLKTLTREISDKHKVIFTGEVSREQTLAHYPLFTMKVLASDMEGLSLALLEAMALGIPVIATNASGNPDLIVQGENGLLFEDGDIEGLAESIQQLIDDAEMSKRLRELGQKTVKREFGLEEMLEGYEEVFMD